MNTLHASPLLGAAASVVFGCVTPAADGDTLAVPPSLRSAVVTPDMGSPHAGDMAPPFDLPRVGGGRVQLEALRGKPVLLHFTATWCPYCREEIAAIAGIARDVGDRGAVVLIDVMESEERWRAFGALPADGADGRDDPIVLLDGDGAVSARYAPPRARPFLERAEVPLAGTMLIDEAGVVRLYVLADNAQFDPTLADLRSVFLAMSASPGPATAPSPQSVVPEVALRASAVRVAPGGTAVLDLHAAIPPGVHVMSEAPPYPELIATSLEVTADDLDAAAPAWPTPVAFRVTDRELPTFQGDLLIRVPVHAPDDAAPGPRRVTARLRYQACTATRCFMPRSASAAVDVEVVGR